MQDFWRTVEIQEDKKEKIWFSQHRFHSSDPNLISKDPDETLIGTLDAVDESFLLPIERVKLESSPPAERRRANSYAGFQVASTPKVPLSFDFQDKITTTNTPCWNTNSYPSASTTVALPPTMNSFILDEDYDKHSNSSGSSIYDDLLGELDTDILTDLIQEVPKTRFRSNSAPSTSLNRSKNRETKRKTRQMINERIQELRQIAPGAENARSYHDVLEETLTYISKLQREKTILKSRLEFFNQHNDQLSNLLSELQAKNEIKMND